MIAPTNLPDLISVILPDNGYVEWGERRSGKAKTGERNRLRERETTREPERMKIAPTLKKKKEKRRGKISKGGT